MAKYKYRISCFIRSEASEGRGRSGPAAEFVAAYYKNTLSEVALLLNHLENESGVAKIVVDTSLNGGFDV